MAIVRVADVMTKRIVYLPSETPLDEAARAMAEADIGDVVVTEGANLAGMVTDRDIVTRSVATNKKPSSVTLGEVAVREIVIIEQSSTLKEAADLMRQRAVRRVLVADADRQLVGIIALGDLALVHETAVTAQRS
ncbi:CBS domain-containing protein [Asanoa sp. NPDC050611]|uniref:CBS domain-containing protein n=1 Tax=Asanoa sp. NPDC050611 TaxID=3157098 RepID=UPI00340068C5